MPDQIKAHIRLSAIRADGFGTGPFVQLLVPDSAAVGAGHPAGHAVIGLCLGGMPNGFDFDIVPSAEDAHIGRAADGIVGMGFIGLIGGRKIGLRGRGERFGACFLRESAQDCQGQQRAHEQQELDMSVQLCHISSSIGSYCS